MTAATTIIPNQTGARVLCVIWRPDHNHIQTVTSPILAWELAPGCDPKPITLLGDLDHMAWVVMGDGGMGYIPGQAVYLSRDQAVSELTVRAKELAGVDP